MADLRKKPKQKKKLRVVIEGESYALDEVPSHDSAVVKAETERLLRVIDLRTLANDLGRVGNFMQIAYNGVGAVGHDYTKEQIEVQRLRYDITKLCDKLVLTIAKFKKASSSILTSLQCTYGYLLDNLEEMALETLCSISKVAGEMEKAALELNNEFVKEENKVIAALENTQNAKQVQASKVEEEKKKRIELEAAIEHEKKLLKEHQEKEREAEARRRELQQLEDQAISEIGSINVRNIFKSLANAFTTSVGVGKVFDTDDASTRVDKLRESLLDVLEAEKAIQDKRQVALANISLFIAKLKQCRNDEEMAECVVEALHEAVGALKRLSLVMVQAANFWKHMQDYCHSLAESEMKSLVEMAMKMSEETRLKVWTSPSFKAQAIGFYSIWIALDSVCGVYMEQIKETRCNFYKYIVANPTYKESKIILSDLIEKFMVELEHDQKDLEEKGCKVQKEILALGPS